MNHRYIQDGTYQSFTCRLRWRQIWRKRRLQSKSSSKSRKVQDNIADHVSSVHVRRDNEVPPHSLEKVLDEDPKTQINTNFYRMPVKGFNVSLYYIRLIERTILHGMTRISYCATYPVWFASSSTSSDRVSQGKDPSGEARAGSGRVGPATQLT